MNLRSKTIQIVLPPLPCHCRHPPGTGARPTAAPTSFPRFSSPQTNEAPYLKHSSSWHHVLMCFAPPNGRKKATPNFPHSAIEEIIIKNNFLETHFFVTKSVNSSQKSLLNLAIKPGNFSQCSFEKSRSKHHRTLGKHHRVWSQQQDASFGKRVFLHVALPA